MNKSPFFPALLLCAVVILAAGCAEEKSVPHKDRWGIYELDLGTQDVRMIYSSSSEISTSALWLNNAGDTLLFSQKTDGTWDNSSEICTVKTDGSNFKKLTNNKFRDIYPAWSPDGSRIAFISIRENDFDIYVMDSEGKNIRKLYDSGSHDADVHWAMDTVAFTADSRIWKINSDGTDPVQVTNPKKAGEWGKANLPFGDYDPRLSPDAKKIVFERLVNDKSPQGNYDIFVVNSDGSGETRITSTGYAQGLASWSNSGAKIVYTVAAVNDQGKYDLYVMNADGTGNHLISPDYFPDAFLSHAAAFSKDDAKIFFIGEWWG